MEEIPLMLSLLAGAGLSLGLAKAASVPRLLRERLAAQGASAAATTTTLERAEVAGMALPAARVPGAGMAMARPPSLRATIQELRRVSPTGRYRIPLGWGVDAQGRPALSHGRLVGDVNHTLITGINDIGKDSAVRAILFSLAALHRDPAEVQFCLIDGKGLDFAGWAGKAHTWQLALKPGEFLPTLQALTQERERRGEILRAAGVEKWDEYQGGDLPLLVVYISELTLLVDELGLGKLEQWLNAELAAGRAFGIRYLIATQTVANFNTRWRSQIGLYLAGFQPRADQDLPNASLATEQLLKAGAVPPSQLPPAPVGAGVFTAVAGRVATTVRFSYLDATERKAWLSLLPDAVVVPAPVPVPVPTPVVPGHVEVANAPGATTPTPRRLPAPLTEEVVQAAGTTELGEPALVAEPDASVPALAPSAREELTAEPGAQRLAALEARVGAAEQARTQAEAEQQALLARLLGLEEALVTAEAAQASAVQRVTELAEQLSAAEAVVDGLIRLARSGNRISGNEICGVLGVRRSVALERIRQAVAARPAQEEVPSAAETGGPLGDDGEPVVLAA